MKEFLKQSYSLCFVNKLNLILFHALYFMDESLKQRPKKTKDRLTISRKAPGPGDH